MTERAGKPGGSGNRRGNGAGAAVCAVERRGRGRKGSERTDAARRLARQRLMLACRTRCLLRLAGLRDEIARLITHASTLCKRGSKHEPKRRRISWSLPATASTSPSCTRRTIAAAARPHTCPNKRSRLGQRNENDAREKRTLGHARQLGWPWSTKQQQLSGRGREKVDCLPRLR